jgi:hypothetical protein
MSRFIIDARDAAKRVKVFVGTHVPQRMYAQGLSEITQTHPRNRKRYPPSANCGSTDGPFQVGCLLFTLPHLHYQPCDFHLSTRSQSYRSARHTFATPWLISPARSFSVTLHALLRQHAPNIAAPNPSNITPRPIMARAPNTCRHTLFS